jgi:hypothetical protein
MHKHESAATTQPQNLNVFSTIMHASSYSGSIVDRLMASTSEDNIPGLPFSISSNITLSNDRFASYVPYILDHQYRIIHEQQLQISSLAMIVAEQQKMLPQIRSILTQQDTILAKHELNLVSILDSMRSNAVPPRTP